MMDSQINKRYLSWPVITGVALLVIIAGFCLYIRIALPYDQVFVDGSVWFRGNDAYYFMRHIDNAASNFPHINSFDPYKLYPGGSTGPSSRPFFVWLVAGIAWLVGLGSPTQNTVDVIGVYVPPILGTLTIIAVYFVGKALFNRWVGLLSAALLVILPGEFLHRSLLGFTDHHVADSLLFSAAMLFLILAIIRASQRQISFTHLLHRDWSTVARPLIYASLAGIFLGIHLLCWRGALLLVFIVFTFLVIQFIIDHLRGKSTDYLCIIGTPYFLIAFIMYLPYLGKAGALTVDGISLLIAILTPIVLSIMSRLMVKEAVKPIYYLPTLAGLAAISLAVFHTINPSLLHSILGNFSSLAAGGAHLTVMEMQPLFFPQGQFSLAVAWGKFTTSFLISFISLGLLIHACIKEESADKTLFLLWSMTTLVAVLEQRRFGDYFAINAALLTGYFCWRMLNLAGLKQLLVKPKQVVEAYTETEEAKATEKTSPQPRATWAKVIVVSILIFFLVFFPNIGRARAVATSPTPIDQGWYSSLLWLKENTPDPFGDPDFYYELYETPFHYPETAYGVMCWWDYGYWIMRISRRIPNSNPGQQNADKVARFFVAQDENSANQIMDNMGSRYAIIDHQMSTAKFHAMPVWAGERRDDFYGIYYVRKEGKELQRVRLLYPRYYNSTVVRLYNFDGKAVVPSEKSTKVISWEWETNRRGVRYKEITNSWFFPSYEDAETFLSSQEPGNYCIGGPNPFVSPVPLAKLEHYKLVYASGQSAGATPSVKIFEYTR